ncbi:helix-turn-helix transcriptional regulator [bacterium]|nr:helix-turn-helix transcriptional regulator [bacterium]
MKYDKKEVLFNIGQKIRIERTKKSLSQEKLAEITNISIKTIGKIERGQTDFVISNLISVAEALNVDVKELFNFTF